MMAGTNILAYFSKKKSFMTFAKKILAGVNTLAYLTKKESLMTFDFFNCCKDRLMKVAPYCLRYAVNVL